jgi:hypothetical protein
MAEKGTKKLQGINGFLATTFILLYKVIFCLSSITILKIPKGGNGLWGIASPSIIQG